MNFDVDEIRRHIRKKKVECQIEYEGCRDKDRREVLKRKYR